MCVFYPYSDNFMVYLQTGRVLTVGDLSRRYSKTIKAWQKCAFVYSNTFFLSRSPGRCDMLSTEKRAFLLSYSSEKDV